MPMYPHHFIHLLFVQASTIFTLINQLPHSKVAHNNPSAPLSIPPQQPKRPLPHNTFSYFHILKIFIELIMQIGIDGKLVHMWRPKWSALLMSSIKSDLVLYPLQPTYPSFLILVLSWKIKSDVWNSCWMGKLDNVFRIKIHFPLFSSSIESLYP